MSRRAPAVDVIAAVDVEAAIDRLMRFLSVEGVSGHEGAIAAAVTDALKTAGVPAFDIRFDNAKQRIPMPTETGNLIVRLPGTHAAPRLAFATHLDTVPLAAGAKPKREGGRIVGDGTTALGGDNRTGCAVLVSLVETLLSHELPHPPLTLVFTVREESGLMGARHMNLADLDGAAMGFNVDGRIAAQLVTGAVGGESWNVEIRGRAAHAGVAPEKGISATLAASMAIAEAHRGGWFGNVVKPNGIGTSNVGVFGGKDGRSAGDATNVVTDYVHIEGESRSDDSAFMSAITDAYRAAFAEAAAQVRDDAGAVADMSFDGRVDYYPFRLAEDAPVVVRAQRAAESIGLEPTTILSRGGLDANWFVEHGVPTVTIGAGQFEIHTVREFIDLAEFANGCRLAVAVATLET